jgi:hypothetical protein
MPTASPEGVKSRRHRAGRVGEMGSPVERVVLDGETRPDGAKERVLRRDSGVASTAFGSFS